MPKLAFVVTAETEEAAARIADFARNSSASVGEMSVKGKKSFTELNSALSLVKQGLEVAKQAWEFGKAGAENERIADSFADTAESVGASADAMAQALDKAAKGTVDDEIYMQTATRNMALGVATSVQENVAIMEMARAASITFGGDTETAFAGISEAIGNLQTRQLKQYGIIIDQKKVNEEYAKSIGKTADALTDAEQREALRNEVLKQSAKLVGDAGNAALTTSEKFKKFETQAGNVIDSLKEFAVDAITPVLDRGAAMQTMMDDSASTSDRLTAAYQLQHDFLAGPMRGVAEQMIVKLQQQAEAEWELFRAQNMRKVSLEELAGEMLNSIGVAARAAGAQQAAAQGQVGLAALYRGAHDDLAAYNEMADATAATLRNQREAMSGFFLTAIEYTKTQQQEAEIKQKLADLDAAIAANGPARTAVIANEKMTVEQRALTEAQLAAAIEHTQAIKRKDGESDAEYNLRLLQANNNVASLTAKLGEHTAVLGGATKAQLEQRDALKEQLAEFQRTQEIERATQAFQTLTKAFQDGDLTYDEFTVRSKTLNTVTGLYTESALAAAIAQEDFLKSLTTTGTTDWAASLATNKEAIDGVAESMDKAGKRAGESVTEAEGVIKEHVTRATNAKQDMLDAMGNTLTSTQSAVTQAVDQSMRSVNTAASTAKSLVKGVGDAIMALPEERHIKIYIETYGDVPDVGGTSSATGGGGSTEPTRTGPANSGMRIIDDIGRQVQAALNSGLGWAGV